MISYVRDNAKELRVDPERVVLSGDSAGGHLAQLAAVTDPEIRGVVSYYGLSDLRTLAAQRTAAGCADRYFEPASPSGRLFPPALTDEQRFSAAAQASPVTHVDTGDPPMLLLHGLEDCIVPAAQSTQMRNTLARVGVDARVLTLDAGHGDPRFYTDPALNAAVQSFLRQIAG